MGHSRSHAPVPALLLLLVASAAALLALSAAPIAAADSTTLLRRRVQRGGASAGPSTGPNGHAVQPFPGAVNGDIPPSGSPCTDDIKSLCQGVTPGDAKVLRCIQGALESAKSVSPQCRSYVRRINRFQGQSVADNPRLNAKCQADMVRLTDPCAPLTHLNGVEIQGGWLLCLESHKDSLQPACRKEVFQQQLNSAADITADAIVNVTCRAAIDALCGPDVLGDEPSDGAIKACLMDNRKDIHNQACLTVLFNREEEDSEDLRLDRVTIGKCRLEIREHCQGVENSGEGLLRACLWDERLADDFSSECKAAIEDVTIREESDYRLDVRIRKKCAADIQSFCADELARVSQDAAAGGIVIECLIEHKRPDKAGNGGVSAPCGREVQRVQQEHAADIRTDAVEMKACAAEIDQFCADVPKGGGDGAVHDCLFKHFNDANFGDACKVAEFSEEMAAAGDVDLKPGVARACETTIAALCADVPKHEGDGAVLECLQDNLDSDDMGSQCAVALASDRASHEALDFRLNAGLFRSCQQEVVRLQCVPDEAAEFDLTKLTNGAVRECLKENYAKIVTPTCKSETFRMMAAMAEDIRDDLVMYDSCKLVFTGRGQPCFGILPGEARVQKCLQTHYDSLPPACKTAVHDERKVESADVMLQPDVKKFCARDIKAMCGNIPHGQGIFQCLVDNKEPEIAEGAAAAGEEPARSPGGAAAEGTGSGLSAKCLDAVVAQQELMATDVHFNPLVEAACGHHIETLCGDVAIDQGHGEILQCLMQRVADIDDMACHTQVFSLMRQRSQDWRSDGRALEFCQDDVERLCSNVQPGMGRENACMRAHMDDLSEDCAAVQEDMVAAESSDYRLNPMVVATCSGARNRYCQGVSPGTGDVLKCLKAAENGDNFAESCRQALSLLAIDATPLSRDSLNAQRTAGLSLVNGAAPDESGGVELHGLIAVAAIVALVLVLGGLAFYAYTKLRSVAATRGKGYSVVTMTTSARRNGKARD